jgi:ABC-type phosphate transport system substrate-binding protein
MRRVLYGLTAGALAVAMVTGFAGSASASSTNLGSGSDTIYNLMVKLDALYNGSLGCNAVAPSGDPAILSGGCAPDTAGITHTENYSHDRFVEAYPIGSSNGIAQLCNQGQAGILKIQYARSSRAISGSDCSNLQATAIAADGVSWWADNANSHVTQGSMVGEKSDNSGACTPSGTNVANGTCVPSITSTQVNAVWGSCADTQWGQIDGLGGSDTTAIQVWAAQSGSGTRAAFESLALGGTNSTTCIPSAFKDGSQSNGERVIFENNAQPIYDANGDGFGDHVNDAIFYYSFGRFQQNTTDSARSFIGAVDPGSGPIVPTASSILGQDNLGNPVPQFPYHRNLNLVYTKVKTSYTCGSKTCTRPAAPLAVTSYMNPKTGWLCKGTSSHVTNPLTGNNYRTDIANAISSEGFVPFPSGAIGGGFTGSSFCRASNT